MVPFGAGPTHYRRTVPVHRAETGGDDVLVARLRAAGCVYAEDEAALLRAEAAGTDHLEAMVVRRCAGEPLETVIGWVELCGVRAVVEPGVFVPRRRSELLIRAAVERLAPGDALIDLCCGSGALGLAAATLVPGVEVHAADLDPRACEVATRNLARVRGTAYCGDLFAALPVALRHRCSGVIATVPYVPTDRLALLPSEARDHEPLMTLDGGPDGLVLARRVVAEAGQWVRAGGWLLIETTDEQAASLAPWAMMYADQTRVIVDDDLDATVVVAVYA